MSYLVRDEVVLRVARGSTLPPAPLPLREGVGGGGLRRQIAARRVPEATGPVASRGAVFIIVIYAMVLFGLLGLTLASIVSTNISGSGEMMQSSQAFYVAEGGAQYVLMNQFNGDSNFADNVSPTDPPFGANSIALDPGEFWVEYANQQTSSADIIVTARVGNAVREVRLSVGMGGGGAQNVTMVDGNLGIANSSGTIFGDVVVSGNYSIGSGVTVNGNITQDSEIEVPQVDFASYRNMTTSTHNGSLVISSDYTGNLYVTGSVVFYGNVTYTGILYVGGSLSFSGSNTIINGTVVVDGNIAMQNSGELRVTTQPSGETFMPAVLSGGNISIDRGNHVEINGALMSEGNIAVRNIGDFDLTGTFTSGGNTSVDGVPDLTITFDADLVAGIPGISGGGGTSGMTLANWRTY